MIQFLKSIVERLFGCRLYRTSLPRGVDLFDDLERDFGLAEFKMVFDVGANVGQSAVEYVRVFPDATIFCFEPVPSVFAELRSKKAQLPRISTFELGMGADEGKADIHVAADSRISSIPNKRPGDSTQIISLATVSGFCHAREIRQLDFLRIDTEGFDLSVLQGAAELLAAGAIHFVQVESAPARQTGYFVGFDEVAEYLRGFGYELYGIYEQTPHWTGRKSLLDFNLVFVSSRLLKEPSFITSMNAPARSQ